MKEGEVVPYRTTHGHWQQDHSWDQAPTLQKYVPVLWSTCAVIISLLLLSLPTQYRQSLTTAPKLSPACLSL